MERFQILVFTARSSTRELFLPACDERKRCWLPHSSINDGFLSMKKRTFAVSRQGPRAFCKPGNVSQSSTADTRRAAVSCQVVFFFIIMHIDDKTATESRSCSVAGEREGGGNQTPDRVPPAARHPAENTWRHTERAVLVQERSSEWRVVPEFKPSTLHSSLLLFYGNSQGNQRFCFTPKLWRRTIVDHLHASELKFKYDLILF